MAIATVQTADGRWPVIEYSDAQESGYGCVSVVGLWQRVVDLERAAGTASLAGAFTDTFIGTGGIAGSNDFGRVQLACVAGTMFDDLDAVQNASDAASAEWTVYLDLYGDGQFGTGEPNAVTGADGRFRFDGLTAGPRGAS